MNKSPLFDIPYWHDHMASVIPYHAEMIDELNRLIDEDMRQNDTSDIIGDQTFRDPFSLSSKGWEILDTEFQTRISEIVTCNFRRSRTGEFHLRRWALRMGSLSDRQIAEMAKLGRHNHYPAMFSSIYYLSIPSEIENTELSGTTFYQPFSEVLGLFAPAEARTFAKEGDLLIFPSVVEHAPTAALWRSSGARDRIVISCDVFWVNGNSD